MKGALVHHPEGAECAALLDSGSLKTSRTWRTPFWQERVQSPLADFLAAFFTFSWSSLSQHLPLGCSILLKYAVLYMNCY